MLYQESWKLPNEMHRIGKNTEWVMAIFQRRSLFRFLFI